MIKKVLSIIFLFLLLTLIIKFFPLKNSHIVFSASSHVVISEIQTASSVSTNDEFVEIYNPTANNIDISGWKIKKKTKLGADFTDVATIGTATISGHGFFLIAHDAYDGTIPEDLTYSSSVILANDNTIALFDKNSNLLDKVGLGDAQDSETTSFPNPATNQSIERKANPYSTAETMSAGGSEETAGNGEDTDNNEIDFVLQKNPNPQNIKSPIEPSISPSNTPMPSPTETPTPILEPTLTIIPTITLAMTPTAIITATVTPTSTPTSQPSPTETPTIIPSNTPTPTIEPQPTLTLTPTTILPTVTNSPSITPSITIKPTNLPYPSAFPTLTKPSLKVPKIVCDVTYFQIKTSLFTINIPRVSCNLEMK